MERLPDEAEKLRYELSERIRPFKGWKQCLAIFFPKCKYGPILGKPLTTGMLKRAEAKISMPMPDDLRSFYRYSDGLVYYGRDIIYSLDKFIDINLAARGGEEWTKINMPLDNLLFFGSLGDGDEYAFGRRVDGEYHSSVFVWRHETDERTEHAGGLLDYLLTWAVTFKTQPHLRRM